MPPDVKEKLSGVKSASGRLFNSVKKNTPPFDGAF